MAIYEDTKGGEPTGWFRCELQRGSGENKQRARTRVRTRAEGVAWEKAVKAAWATGGPLPTVQKAPEAPSNVLTIKACIRKAEGRLWVGKSVEKAYFKSLDFCAEVFGPETPVADIGFRHIDDLVADLVSEGRGPSTVNSYLVALNGFLQWALKSEYRSAPVPPMVWQKRGEGRIRWFTPQEEAQLLTLLPEPIANLVRLGIATGMRLSEILSLQHSQIDTGWIRMWKTKNDNPRSVPVSADIADLARRMIDAGMPTDADLRREWRKARKAMGLENDADFVFHVTRHTCATRLVNANVNLRVIQKWLGHKRIETTIRYAQVMDETLVAALATRSSAGGGMVPLPVTHGGGISGETGGIAGVGASA